MNRDSDLGREKSAKNSALADFSYLCEISFDGTEYNGWQRQPNAKTIQGTIEKKLTYLYDCKNVPVVGSGRTDSGVHAMAMAVSFVPPKTSTIDINTLYKALNSILPFSIRVNTIEKKNVDFNARFDSKGKVYTYVIHNSANSRPFSSRYSLQIKQNLNPEKMEMAATYLIGEHDFSSFAVGMGRDEKNPIRVVHDIRIQTFGEYICISVIGKSFLYKMVRSIIGTLMMCGSGKIKPDSIQEILNQKKRETAYNTVEPHGLFLMKVFFNEEEWKTFSLSSIPFHN